MEDVGFRVQASILITHDLSLPKLRLAKTGGLMLSLEPSHGP